MPEPSINIVVRRLRVGDDKIVRACVAIGARKYPAFDQAAAHAWGVAALGRDDIAILVTANCFLVAVIYERFWAPGLKQADVAILCSGRDDKRSAGQLMALARAARAWALEKGCRRLDFAAETNIADLKPLAQRLGDARQYSAYMLELTPKGS